MDNDEERYIYFFDTAGLDLFFETLSIFGPLQAHRGKSEDPACPWGITAELWKRGEGARLMEVSIKSQVAQAAVATAGFLAFLAEVGAEQDLEQQTETRWALSSGEVEPVSNPVPEAQPALGTGAQPQGLARGARRSRGFGGVAMSTIIPRWEWRTFGGDLAGASARLEAQGPTGPQESDEVYLLSTLVDANIKIRDGLLDIKRLAQTNGDGLEQWRPVLKAELPLPAGIIHQAFQALGLPVPALGRSEYGLDQLRAELIAAEPRLRALDVHKERRRYRLGGCACEVTDVVAEGHRVRTLAVESEDPEAVIATVRGLGLGGIRNQSYPRGLKALIGLPVEGSAAGRRFAVIDLGTNSVKLHVGERDPAGRWRRLLDRSEVTRLGEGLAQTGMIAPAAQERTLSALRGMVEDARRLGVEQLVAVGTMGMRSAANSDVFISAVRDALGLTIEVIDGEEEARLAYRAVEETLAIPGGTLVVFDTGGGSTQVTLGRAGRILERFSLNLGAARLTERFGLGGPVSRETLQQAGNLIAEELGRLDSLERPDGLVGLGGGVTNLTAVSLALSPYDPDRIQGAVLTRAEVERQIACYAGLDAAGRRGIVGLQPGRAEVILAGALVVRTLMEKLGQDRLSVSDRGLRHGALMERFSGA